MSKGTSRKTWAAALVLVALPAAAQDLRPVEVTPYVASGTSGASPFGALVTIPITASVSAETELAYRHEPIAPDLLSSSASLLLFFPTIGRARPYVATGAGVSQFDVPAFGPQKTPIGAERRVAWTVNVGGGFTIPLSEHVGLRTDARYFDSLGEGHDQFRVAHGVSFGVGKPRK